jgi:hypothetical protein
MDHERYSKQYFTGRKNTRRKTIKIEANIDKHYLYNKKLKKSHLYLLGLLTLIVFPLPAFFILRYTQSISIDSFLQLNQLQAYPILIGIEFGLFYASIAAFIMQSPALKPERLYHQKMLQGLNMNVADMLFLSLCAGIGEELLFRVGVQHYLGPLWTSLLFVALHGYYNPFSWRKSIYGLCVTPFILLIALGMNYFGLWFCISAHAAYDLFLFLFFGKNNKKSVLFLTADPK